VLTEKTSSGQKTFQDVPVVKKSNAMKEEFKEKSRDIFNFHFTTRSFRAGRYFSYEP